VGLEYVPEKLPEKRSEDGDALFYFLYRRVHGHWGNPVKTAEAFEPFRTQHYLQTG
jgi:hypothetical protein